MKRTVLLIVIILSLLTGIVFIQKKLTASTGLSWKTENLTFFPDDSRIRPALLGFDVTISHCLWIRTVIYFGSHHLTDKNYTWLIKMVDIITKLNPEFYPAYEFAGVILPEVCNNSDAARVILERGLFNLGDRRWNIPFYLGMLYYKYYGDKKTAAEYFLLASHVKNAPVSKMVGLAAAFYAKAGEAQVGYELLKITCESSENPEVRRHLAEKVISFGRIYKIE
jgi:hypothetical protein